MSLLHKLFPIFRVSFFINGLFKTFIHARDRFRGVCSFVTDKIALVEASLVTFTSFSSDTFSWDKLLSRSILNLH